MLSSDRSKDAVASLSASGLLFVPQFAGLVAFGIELGESGHCGPRSLANIIISSVGLLFLFLNMVLQSIILIAEYRKWQANKRQGAQTATNESLSEPHDSPKTETKKRLAALESLGWSVFFLATTCFFVSDSIAGALGGDTRGAADPIDWST